MEVSQKPQVFLKKITFNDNTGLSLERGSIVVFTGANNCGKSQVLKDIEYCLDQDKKESKIIVKNSEFEFIGQINETKFLDSHFILDKDGRYHPLDNVNLGLQIDNLLKNWTSHRFYYNLHKLFVNRLDTEQRLIGSNPLQRNSQPEKHPIYKICKSERLAQKISDYFHLAFNEDLIVNRNKMTDVPLHIGKAPNKCEYTIDKQDDYYELIDKLPLLQNQGDGMRSFASILLDTFTSDASITLIDEPEAFLHPPQARILGKMLAENNSEDRQLFISTHSQDFLQGLLYSNNKNITVVRINRDGNINRMNILSNDKIKELWKNPILRYSNILSGLFHEKVIVCESDYDCLFYHALMTELSEKEQKSMPDILFTQCGGKHRIKDIVKALKAVDVTVVAITDFDLLNDSRTFKSIISAFGVNYQEVLESDMKIIYDNMNAKKDAWEQIKKIGKHGFSGDAPSAYENVEAVCKSIGLFVVPVGEIECFDKTINEEKKDWVYEVLKKYDLKNEIKLEEARKFVDLLIDFRLSNHS